MPIIEFEGHVPSVDPTAFVAPTASIVGDVTIEAHASVWYGAVLRGDYAPIVVRAGANVQDGAVLHAPPGSPVEVGPGATVAHNCVVHGAVLGAECLVANGAIVLDGARIGARSLVAAGSIVPAGREIPDDSLAMGAPAVVKGPVPGTSSEIWVTTNPSAYRDLAERHRVAIRVLDEG
jgi:carbonic anhydrase/acetyltransferase-like protein (isoleucine patch superfamily)